MKKLLPILFFGLSCFLIVRADTYKTIGNPWTGKPDYVTVGSSGGSPAGSTGDVQYKNGGSFGSMSPWVWDSTNTSLGFNTITTNLYPLQIRANGAAMSLDSSDNVSGEIGTLFRQCVSGTCADKGYWGFTTRGVFVTPGTPSMVLKSSDSTTVRVYFPSVNTSTYAIQMPNQEGIQFFESGYGSPIGSNFVSIRASETIANDMEWVLPDVIGTTGQVIGVNSVNGNRVNLTFATPASASLGIFTGSLFIGLASGTTFQAFLPTQAITLKNATFTIDVAGISGSGDKIVCGDGTNSVSVTSAAGAVAGTVTTSATTSANIPAGATIYMRLDSSAATKPQGNAVCTYVMQ